MLLTHGGGPAPDRARGSPERDASEGSSCWTTPSSARVKAVSYNTIKPSVFYGRCYFSGDVISWDMFCSIPYLCGGASNLPHRCDNRWGSSFKTWANLPKSGCLASLLHRRYVQPLQHISKTTDLKVMSITVVLCLCYKPPKLWKEFWVLLQAWKQAKVHEEVP